MAAEDAIPDGPCRVDDRGHDPWVSRVIKVARLGPAAAVSISRLPAPTAHRTADKLRADISISPPRDSRRITGRVSRPACGPTSGKDTNRRNYASSDRLGSRSWATTVTTLRS